MSITALSQQRCLHHPGREAVARCPECQRFFCRECITEHEDRVLCASCLQRLSQAQGQAQRRVWASHLRPLAATALGVLMAWISFYQLGRWLLSTPSKFHSAEFWKQAWLGESDE